ncbi:hypothetical protein E4U42_001209 [Claviceps africana]|uniref:Uncharacterized protein n=1 Tax=Claviceps africana TaxID=83212 RepID=A0A8K0JCA7_9HYPO|nr:hypothetical protein E4U42_001209 [Claviceps africana]
MSTRKRRQDEGEDELVSLPEEGGDEEEELGARQVSHIEHLPVSVGGRVHRVDPVKASQLTLPSCTRYVSTGDEDDGAEEEEEEEGEGEKNEEADDDVNGEEDEDAEAGAEGEAGADSNTEDAAEEDAVNGDEPPPKKRKKTDATNGDGTVDKTTNGHQTGQEDAIVDADADADADAGEVKKTASGKEAVEATEAPLASAEAESGTATAGGSDE